MLTKILIANRGEIACRIAATAHRLGIQTVAVYSTADAQAKHVAVCDESVLIGPAPAADSYLRADRIIEAALATGAQAVHPGYGFLSEHDGFAEACVKAGLVFIGPPAAAIRAMGSKSAAKALMEKANVPLVPGYHGDNQDADVLQEHADRIGYPVLLKASLGGGGKGMRIVECSADFKAALASCQREARNSFGNDQILLEQYLTRPRHIEIQVFADAQGQCVYLFERDCSVQRRHQKVLEEAPAPGLSAARRQAMGAAAVAAAKAVGYVGAGTVEFIVNADGAFYFMEMNTRLQVEHPVTEMITGIDLVEWQLRVAAGEALPMRQAQLAIHGHAVEARVYAENPDNDFLPSIGKLQYLQTPAAVAFEIGQGRLPDAPAAIRIDSGVREGDAITAFYDPMIAKLIVWGRDRAAALAGMAQALGRYEVVGLATNVAFLKRVVESRAFVDAELDTGLIARHHDELFAPQPAPGLPVLALAAAAQLGLERAGAATGDPWSSRSGWRMNETLSRVLVFATASQVARVVVGYEHAGLTVRLGDAVATLTLDQQSGQELAIGIDGATVRGKVVREESRWHIFTGGAHYVLAYQDAFVDAGPAELENGRLTAPMAGKIVTLLVEPGSAVEKGAPLLIMEAMKMEHTITAPAKGVVEALLYAAGDQVTDGTQLLVFRAA